MHEEITLAKQNFDDGWSQSISIYLFDCSKSILIWSKGACRNYMVSANLIRWKYETIFIES